MSASDFDAFDRAEGSSPAEAAETGISAIIFQFFAGISVVLAAAFDGIADLFDTLAAVRDTLITIITSPTPILTATAEFSAFSLTQGDWAFFGPFTWVVGVGVVAGGFLVWDALDPDLPFIQRLMFWRE